MDIAILIHNYQEDKLFSLFNHYNSKLINTNIYIYNCNNNLNINDTSLNIKIVASDENSHNKLIDDLYDTKYDLIICFTDPILISKYSAILYTLIVMCDIHQVPLAFNTHTAINIINQHVLYTNKVHMRVSHENNFEF